MSTNEAEWLQAAQNGSEEGFTYLVEKYQTPVYNLCYRMLGNAGDAEDAAQETFWRAYQAINRSPPLALRTGQPLYCVIGMIFQKKRSVSRLGSRSAPLKAVYFGQGVCWRILTRRHKAMTRYK